MNPALTRPAALAALIGLAGCTPGAVLDRDPRFSGVEMSPSSMPEVARVQVPMPPPSAPPVRARAQSASLWGGGGGDTRSFFADQRASDVGDILTIRIEIDDQARLNNSTQRSRQGGGSLGFPTFFGYGSQIDKILPGVGPDDLPQGDIVDISASQQSSGDGQIKRQESISLRVAALVVQKLPNGNLVVAGRQEVKVNEELRELRVAGIIRPEDIGRENSIDYDKIAEARISYGGRGALSRQQRRGYGEDVLDVILPY
ncbi:flagellar basal body L-ring protein FlgH [Profundibacterium mesophilum]|uniref:Flagellar L-ring protein n=1 Tax=Profundibacterium mesophilum KAUST100406-0324 TaxID=1037889 RepID=A0A921NSK3_9RHOB|nr:flagellar basal body L-ring protein FlgH [Profundibacterium mesophilum]KAF0674650.1 Flagellar L-ring protein 2 [Profundibacterium mesophilum KAUST100406-0324]